nr:MAG TPA: hypothetical protein [Caudoviricetes sp.]
MTRLTLFQFHHINQTYISLMVPQKHYQYNLLRTTALN